MKILHVSPYYAPAWAFGGVVRAVTGLAAAQAAAGHSVFVLTTDALDRERRMSVRREILQGVSVLRSPNLSRRLRGWLNLSTPLDFRATAQNLLQSHQIHIVHCHELRTVENWQAAPAAAEREIPLVLSPHGTLPYQFGRGFAKRAWDWTIGRRLAPLFDRVIALTPAEAQQARIIWSAMNVPLDESQIAVIPNGVDLDSAGFTDHGASFRKKWGLGSGPVVLFTGRLAKRKRLRLLLSAFVGLTHETGDARLLIVGPDDGELRRLRSLAQRRVQDRRVVFTGLLAGAALQAAYAAADVFVLPAGGEGFSMAALEALAAGLPVVLTPDCGLDGIPESDAGLVVPPEVESLRQAIRQLLSDPARRASMGRRGRALAEANYGWPRIASRTEAVYQEAIAQRSRAVG